MSQAKWNSMSAIKVEQVANIVKVRLNRPEKMNAISSTMEKEFYAVLADCERMEEVKCVVLTAEGPISRRATMYNRWPMKSLAVKNLRRFKISIGFIPVIFFRLGDLAKA